MAKGSNSTRGGGGASSSTARVVTMDTFQRGVDNLYPSNLGSGNHTQAEVLEDNIQRMVAYSDEMTNRLVLSGQLGRTDEANRYRELMREADRRLEEMDRQYKRLTGRSFGYAE